MSTPFFFPPATKVSTPIIYSSLHSRHTITYPQKLGFHLMGLFFNFGPTTIMKLPNIRSDGSSPPTARPTWIDFCHGSPLFLNVTVILLIVLKIGPTFKNSMKDIKSAPPTFLWLWQNLCCRIASLECYTPGFTFIESKFNQPSIVSTFQIRIQLPYQELQLRSLKSHSSTVYQILSDLEGLHKHCPSNSTTLMLHISVSVGHGHHPNRGATSICWFGRYHCQEGHSHQISSTTGNVLGPLRASFLLRLSRTRDIAFFCAELTFGRKGLWRKSCSILEGFSAQPSSLVERTVSCLLGFSKWFPETIEAKEPFSTSRILLIVTIFKLLECFAEVSLTHHDLACDMLGCSFYLRVPMDLSLMFNGFSIFLVTFDVCLILICLMYQTIRVDALYSLSFLGWMKG